MAHDFKFKHGTVSVHEDIQTQGLQYAWFNAWTPVSENERAVIIEDDMELSPLWFVWLKKAWSAYGERDDLGSISLCRQRLRASDGAIVTKHMAEPFLYRMIGSFGFSPNAKHWKPFVEWIQSVDIKTINIDVPGTISTQWHRYRPDSWEQYYIWRCQHERLLYALYVHFERGFNSTLGRARRTC